MLKFTKIFEYTLDVFENSTDLHPSRELQILAPNISTSLVFPIWKCCLYKEYGYLSNRTVIYIFKGNSFMQRGFCRCKMCLNVRMDKYNDLICTHMYSLWYLHG
jgi:hypothetical protein